MTTKRLGLIIVVIAVLSAAPAWAFSLLDPLNSGAINEERTLAANIPPGAPLSVSGEVSAPTCWGGVRGWALYVSSGTAGSATRVRVQPQFTRADYENSSDIQGYMELLYGSFTTAGQQDNDWSGIYALRVLIYDVDDGTGILTASLDTNGSVWAVPGASGLVVAAPGEYLLPFSLFTQYVGGAGGPLDLTDVDGLTIRFSTQSAGWDIILRGAAIGLTPEPTTMTLLGLGVVALLRRRRRKN